MPTPTAPEPTIPITPLPTASITPTALPTSIPTCETDTYYVDPQDGADENSGQCTFEAWKHAPGDPDAQASAASTQLAPGAIIKFRGGTAYRGTIRIPASGTLDSPLIYSGDTWPGLAGVKAVIDGSEPLSGWLPCESQESCNGNPNWAQIYYTFAPQGVAPFTANLYQDDEMLVLSQHPNPSNRFYLDNHGDYLRIQSDAVTSTSIRDPRLENLGGEALVGSYIAIWAVPNVIVFSRILDWDGLTGTIEIEDIGTPQSAEGLCYYSILNHGAGAVLDSPGEFYLDEKTDAQGRLRFYVWPLHGINLTTQGNVSVSLRSNLINFGAREHVIFEGFMIQKGLGTVISNGWTRHGYITLRNNEITRGRTKDTANMLYFHNAHHITIENNYLHHNFGRMRGIVLGAEDSSVRGNYIEYQGGTTIYFGGTKRSSIIGNTSLHSNGSHSNGITVYQGSEDILVANNRVVDSNISFTMQASRNLTLYNNILIGAQLAGYLIADWGGMSGRVAILNNLVLGSSNDASVYVHSADEIILKNNILDGGGGGARSHNIYVSLSWSQSERYGWYPAEGEQVSPSGVIDLSTIFASSPRLGTSILSRPDMNSMAIDKKYASLVQANDRLVIDQKYPSPHVITATEVVGQRLQIWFEPATGELGGGWAEIWPANSKFEEDYRLRRGGPAIDGGINVLEYLPSEIFPEFNFLTDASGGNRPASGAWDIGPY